MGKEWVMVRITKATHKRLCEIRSLQERLAIEGKPFALDTNRDGLLSLDATINALIDRDNAHRLRARKKGSKEAE
jgi:hypothetical protein